MRQKPLLAVDIDGVISLFGSPGPWEALSGGDARIDGSLHTIDGVPHFLSRDAAKHLTALAEWFELVWASGWEEKADEHLPHLLGLPKGLPHLSFERSPGKGNAHWKLAAIERHAGARPLAWIDDALSEECYGWARDRSERGAPTMLVQTSPERGLTDREARILVAWVRELESGLDLGAQSERKATARARAERGQAG
jgi:hypothetical protein